MSYVDEITAALSIRLKPYKNARAVFDFLRKDEQVNSLLNASNAVAIQRLGYNDHGITHAHITLFNAVKMLQLIEERKILPNLVKESNKATLEDSLEVVIVAAYLHDVGNAVMRTHHELFSMVLVREILNRIYKKPNDLNERKKAIIMEGIIAHMGRYKADSIEAKIISVADACDMEKGRARIPYNQGKKDIHSMSALSIETVRLKPGVKKPIRIVVDMANAAGMFQVEELLVKKIKAAEFQNYVEIETHIHDRNETIVYFE